VDPCLNPADPFGLLDPETRQDPYRAYERLRREAPVYHSESWNGWLLTRYPDVLSSFRDPRLSSNRSAAYAGTMPAPVREKLAPLLQNLGAWAFLLDPPDHTRLRALINKAFAPRLIEGIRPRIETIVDRLLDQAEREGRMDLIGDFASSLPVIVIADILGVPEGDHFLLKPWSDALAAFMGAGRPSMESAGQALQSVLEMERYFRAILAERRRAPREDLLSSLLSAEDQGQFLNEQELLSTCTMVLFGGHETTTNQIGTGVLSLLNNPDQLEALRDAPELAANAIEELLRYDSPVQRQGRIALQDLTIQGQQISKGDRVFLVLGAAHRDEAQFPDPDRLDIRRADVRHLAFGMGAHYCVGAALARIEAQVTITSLLRRFPRLSLASAKVDWLDNLTIRGPRALPLTLY
jgi:cytochrome P450